MPHFDQLRERLLRAGIAPRHVRRYLGELRDHFDDLVREEVAGGTPRATAEAHAAARLGRDDDLAEVMLAQPGLRSMTARFPWAVFCCAPVAMVIAALAVALIGEIGAINLVSAHAHANGWKPSPAALKEFTLIVEVWNTLAVYIAPLCIAALLYLIGTRQRMPFVWIVTGAAIACIFGASQELSWYDTGTHGELSLSSAFIPPFPHLMASVVHALFNLALAGGAFWIVTRRQAMESTAPLVTTAAE